MPDIFEEEADRARLHRAQWNQRVDSRMRQLQRLSGSREALAALWASWQNIYRTDNFIGTDATAEEDAPGDEGGYDIALDSGGASSRSDVELPGVRHAGDTPAESRT